jgi:hypothetical protein
VGLDPLVERRRVEAYELADLQERHPSLLDETPHEPDADAETLGRAVNIEESATSFAGLPARSPVVRNCASPRGAPSGTTAL